MSDQRVNQVITPVSEAEVTNALIEATKKLYGIDLSKSQVAILISQNNLETNHRKSMHNYNIGNITHTPSDSWDYFIGGDKSKDKNGNWQRIHMKFRSYPTLLDGAKDYIRNIHNRGGGGAWQQIINADVDGFSKELKRTNYYEADEKAYTNALLGGTNSFSKQNSYEQAKSGQFEKAPVVSTNEPYDGSVIASTYSSESLVPDGANQSQVTQNDSTTILTNLESYLDQFLSSVASLKDDKSITKATYKKFLHQNNLLIKINSNDITDSLEFARILCLALDEEAQADTVIHSNKKNVEVACVINGPENICYAAVHQLCTALTDNFKQATKKIGGCIISTEVQPNAQPIYQKLDLKLARLAYRQFHLKFIK